MNTLSHTDELRVVFAGRPRSWSRTAIHNGRRLTPKALRSYKRMVAHVMRLARLRRSSWPGECKSTRFKVRIDFRMPDRRHCDIDNLAKAVLDAGNGLLWADDWQIDALHLTKKHRSEDPGFQMLVEACCD